MSFTTKELNEACKSLNTVLEKEERIKYVGVKTSEVVKEFQKKVEKRSELGKNIPDDVVDFYNVHFAEDTEEEETAKEETPMKAEKETKKEKKEKTKDKKEKKTTKAKEDKKEKKTKTEEKKTKKTENPTKEKKEKSRVSREQVKKRNSEISKLISKGKYTKKQIIEKISEKFPEVKPITIATFVQDCMNPKYNKLDKLTVKSKEGILSFKG